jgi:hypothetical protein
MFERNNAVSRNAVVTRGSSGGAWVIAVASVVAFAAMSAPRVHVLAGVRAARSALGAFLGTPITLADETVAVPMASSRGVPIRLSFPGILQIEVNVVGGAQVNVHVISASDWNALQKAEGRLLGGRFRFDFPELQALATSQARLSGRLWEGPYFIVIENPSLSAIAAPPYDVRVRVTLRP